MIPLTTLHLAHLSPSLAVHVALCRDVRNAAFLRQQLLDGNPLFEYALLDASAILSPTHLLAAVFRAATDQRTGRLKSRNVHSEIVFALSPNNNIAESFRRFGISDKTTDLLVVKLGTPPAVATEGVAAHLEASVEGQWVEFNAEAVGESVDVGKVRRYYKLGDGGGAPKEAEKGEMEVVILGLMALRGAS